MNNASRHEIRLGEQVRRALEERTPIVALESTVIAHGLPHPLNLETALACEQVIRRRGLTPATIGIVDGAPTVGLSEEEIKRFATGEAPGGARISKIGLNNLASVMMKRGWGATTVASSLKLAHVAGIRVFSTGGIGGVHRRAAESFDVSADLTALGDTPVVCVCAGAKAILDLPKTLEYLETLGVPVVGYQTDEFPAFYSRGSGLAVDAQVATPDEAADFADRHWRMGARTAVLVCAPVPGEFEIPASAIAAALEEVMARATRQGVRGKAVTPFLLAELEKVTGGRTVETNRALLTHNAAVAASIAESFSKRSAFQG